MQSEACGNSNAKLVLYQKNNFHKLFKKFIYKSKKAIPQFLSWGQVEGQTNWAAVSLLLRNFLWIFILIRF